MKGSMKKKNPTVEELRAGIDPGNLPRHIAIIMDGNGRWAVRRGMPRIAGHKKGPTPCARWRNCAARIKISVLTLYAFSDENWGRPQQEVSFLMEMLESYLKTELGSMKEQGIRFRTIGRTERLPASVQDWIRKAMAETAGNTGLILNLALSYGGRGEIIEAIKRLQLSNGSAGSLTEESFSSHLDTAGLPDPDLIIRTSGEKRISNFLLWQAAYAELHFTDTLWPDFGEKDLLLAILDYQGRQRRFGLTGEQLAKTPARR